MSNLALETAGAEVVTASTIDPRHPPACVIDGYVHARALFYGFQMHALPRVWGDGTHLLPEMPLRCGGCVLWATSNETTFWATTGLFPQELIIKLGTAVSITKIKTVTTNGTRVRSRCRAIIRCNLGAMPDGCFVLASVLGTPQ